MNLETITDTYRELLWPNLKKDSYKKTSCSDGLYNCLGWAVGKDDQWWEPAPIEIDEVYWPPHLPREYTFKNYIDALDFAGFKLFCDNGDLEQGFEKVAIYKADDGEDCPTHFARQLEDGSWTSKMGDWEDIKHPTCQILEDGSYGKVVKYLKRPKH